jgi:hypothetical protein
MYLHISFHGRSVEGRSMCGLVNQPISCGILIFFSFKLTLLLSIRFLAVRHFGVSQKSENVERLLRIWTTRADPDGRFADLRFTTSSPFLPPPSFSFVFILLYLFFFFYPPPPHSSPHPPISFSSASSLPSLSEATNGRSNGRNS